jgi:myb proto-oncogene protein
MDDQQENKHVDTDKDVTSFGEESSMPESSIVNTTTSVGITNHDQDPLVKWLMEEEEDMPIGVVDESWLHLTASDNIDDLNIITATTPWDIVRATDWLLDYQDFGVEESSLLVDVSMVDNSSRSNL